MAEADLRDAPTEHNSNAEGTPDGSQIWDQALLDYEEKRAASDLLPLGAEREDEAVDVFCEAMDQLILHTKAPDLAAVITKMELALEREPADFADYGQAVIEDLRRLHSRSPLQDMAIAWIDRWRALGGSFGWLCSADGSERSLQRGIPMSYVWEPPSCEEAIAQSPKLRPHEVIIKREQFEGAHKMLESFLTLVPGLQDAVFDIAEELVIAGRGHADKDYLSLFLERRRAATMSTGEERAEQ